MADVTQLLQALSTLLWPVIAAIALWLLVPALKEAIRTGNITVKVGDKEVTIQKASEQIATQLNDVTSKVAILWQKTMTEAETAALNVAPQDRGYPRSILWVDDTPENNAFYVEILRQNGIDVAQAVTTDEAVRQFDARRPPFEAVITDLGRREGGRRQPTAGLTLARQIRERNPQVPVLVFTTPDAVREFRDRVKEAGATGVTASGVELLRLLQMPGHVIAAA